MIDCKAGFNSAFRARFITHFRLCEVSNPFNNLPVGTRNFKRHSCLQGNLTALQSQNVCKQERQWTLARSPPPLQRSIFATRKNVSKTGGVGNSGMNWMAEGSPKIPSQQSSDQHVTNAMSSAGQQLVQADWVFHV